MSINGLASYTLTVPDAALGRDYYANFGLEAEESNASITMRCSGRDQGQVRLHEGPTKLISSVHFTAEPGSLAEIRSRVVAGGARECDPPAGGVANGAWFTDPDGLFVNVVEGSPAPPRPATPTLMNLPGSYPRVDEARWSTVEARVQPHRLGHMLIFVSDMIASERFYLDLLGLRPSDRIGTEVSFWNAGPGDHHVFGAIASTHVGFQHASFEVSGVDDLAMGAQWMADQGHDDAWGLGRHAIGSNLFYYIRDPWGSWTEYFCDIDQVTDAWKPQCWDLPPHVWGPRPPDDFILNREDRSARPALPPN